MNNSTTRKEMGFTQQELAGCLGLHRTQLALFEKGHRWLPYKAVALWSQLEQCLENKEALGSRVKAIMAEQQPQAGKELRLHARKCKWAAKALRLKLARMEEQYLYYLNVLAFVDQVPQLICLNRRQRVWLNRLEARAQRRCAACGPGKQAILALRLEAQLLVLEQLYNNHRIS